MDLEIQRTPRQERHLKNLQQIMKLCHVTGNLCMHQINTGWKAGWMDPMFRKHCAYPPINNLKMTYFQILLVSSISLSCCYCGYLKTSVIVFNAFPRREIAAVIHFGSESNMFNEYIKFGIFQKIEITSGNYDFVIQFIRPPKGGKFLMLIGVFYNIY